MRPYDPVIFREVLSGIKDLRNLSALAMNGGEPFAEMWIIEMLSKIAAAKTLKQLVISNFEPNYKELAEMPYVLPALEVIGFPSSDRQNLSSENIRELLKDVAPRLREIR